MIHKDVGVKIRNLRKENKDTLKSLACKINYDWSNLSKVERGTYTASLELLKKIIDLYGIDSKYFFGDGFTNEEGDLLLEENLAPSLLKEKYNFKVDGIEATEEEIMEAIRLIRHFRAKEE